MSAPPPGRPGHSARLPVPGLLVDLAAWAWRLVLLGGFAWLLLKVAERLYLVSVPLAAALVITALLSPVTHLLRRHGVPRVVATILTVVVVLLVLGGVLAWVVDQAIQQFPQLVAQVSRSVQQLPVHGDTLMHWRDQLGQQLQSHGDALTQGAITGVTTAGEAATGALLTLLLTLILLTDGERVWHWLVDLLPGRDRAQVQEAGAHAFHRLSGWIRGTFLIALFHGVVVAVTLFVLGVPLVLPLAILVFLGSFIPIVGAVAFGGVAVLVAFASSGLTAAIVLVVVLLIDNQIESHVLQPFLVGRYVRLHPFVVAIVITAGALLEGIIGAVLAVPLTAALYAAVQHLGPTRARVLGRWPRAAAASTAAPVPSDDEEGAPRDGAGRPPPAEAPGTPPVA